MYYILIARFFDYDSPLLLVVMMMMMMMMMMIGGAKKLLQMGSKSSMLLSEVWVSIYWYTKFSHKSPMGLQPFEDRFFFEEKFTNFDLAIQAVIKNRSKVF